MLRVPLLDARIDLADTIGVRDSDWALDDAEIVEVSAAGHLPIAVEIEKTAIDRARVRFASRKDDGDAGPYRSKTDL